MVEALRHRLDSSVLSDRHRAAMRFAGQLITDPTSISDDLMAEVRRHFSAAEVLELCHHVLFFNISHRYAAALHIEPPQGRTIAVKPNPFLARRPASAAASPAQGGTPAPRR